jgi:tRNA U34 5-methylaminomethyl-2-thiouridine-forming methyltransferase MnmC
MSLEFKLTSDQSPTLYHTELDEHYHSVHGAYQESVHVYIHSGLELFREKKNIRVLEMGFGTGLNVLLAAIFAEKHQIPIQLVTIEKYPLPSEIWEKLTYFKNTHEQDVFTRIHSEIWERELEITEFLRLTKIHTDLEKFETFENFDVVFFDAFGPDKQPHLWETSIFKKLLDMMNPQGILVTYSAKGQVRRNMIAAGFSVERIPGPPGKREMLRATKLE